MRHQVPGSMRRLENPIRRYPWGSLDAIPRLVGVEPDGQPQAELWLGAHERAPSAVHVDGKVVGLDELVALDPWRELGAAWAASGRLPFLAKVIAVAAPLSLQVHPDAAHAARGFAAEEAAGVERDSPLRSFPDSVAKVEMVLALSDFGALCGFRAAADCADWLDELAIPALEPTAETLRLHGESALPDEVERLLRRVSPADVTPSLGHRCAPLVSDDRWGHSARIAAELAECYPDDPAVSLALLLRPVALAPGETMSVYPGQPHSYLSGTAFEVQANSDNVLRAGLTTKHVSVSSLVDALDTRAGHASTVVSHLDGAEEVFAPQTECFALSIVRSAAGELVTGVPGPQLFCCLEGEFALASDGDEMRLTRGESAYRSAGGADMSVRGAGMLLRVTTGRGEHIG